MCPFFKENNLLLVTNQLGFFCSVLHCDSVVFSPPGPEIWANVKPVCDTGALSSPFVCDTLSQLCWPRLKLKGSLEVQSAQYRIRLLFTFYCCECFLYFVKGSWWRMIVACNLPCSWKPPDLPCRMFSILQYTLSCKWHINDISAYCQFDETRYVFLLCS